MESIDTQVEKVILVGITSQAEGTPPSILELAELVETAGAESVGILLQRRDAMHPRTYIGTGKLSELYMLIQELGATGIVCDDELSPSQVRNMEEVLQTKVMDRTLVILDIFAAHATTSEGKLQVELAQLKHRLTQLTGMGRSMSRLGGGIGTRGPGEKKLETDRRLINHRISRLRREMKDVEQHREINREHRIKNSVPVGAIVGYTNAGKSTLLNALTGAEVLEADMLFATLDPTTRMLELPGSRQMLLTDTVGFIQKLPHSLVEAFHSTLEEAGHADFIIHVVDASNERWEEQMRVVYDTLAELKIRGKKVLTVFNKMDQAPTEERYYDLRADKIVRISAKKGDGLDLLQEEIMNILREDQIHIEKVFSYEEMGKIARIRQEGQLLKEEFLDEGIFVEAYVDASFRL